MLLWVPDFEDHWFSEVQIVQVVELWWLIGRRQGMVDYAGGSLEQVLWRSVMDSLAFWKEQFGHGVENG
jgi:hypothetical protein